MNWLGRLLLGSPPAPAPAPPPAWGRCPKCSGIEHSVQMVVYGCQRCQRVYTVGPNGVFDQHLASLPPTPRMVLRNPGADAQPSRPDDDEAPRRRRAEIPVPLDDRPDA